MRCLCLATPFIILLTLKISDMVFLSQDKDEHDPTFYYEQDSHVRMCLYPKTDAAKEIFERKQNGFS